MVKPAYILFAKSASQDKDTGSFSIFDIIERLQLTPLPKPADPNQQVMVLFEPMRIIACWSSETDEDRGHEYDHEIVAFLPGELSSILGSAGKFRFQAGMQNFRITAVFATPLPITKPGILRFQSKVRITGAQNWQTQSYSLPVEILPEQPVSPSPSGTTEKAA